MKFTLIPSPRVPHLLDKPLQWSLDLWTEDQMSFYAKRGYVEISQLHKPGRTLYIMEKELRVSD